MHRTLAAALVFAITACGRSQTPAASTIPAPQDCPYEIVQPDTSAAARRFRDWLNANAETLPDLSYIDFVRTGDVFIANLDNDGADEFLFAWHEGSGSYLSGLVFRPAGDTWSLVKQSPFTDEEQVLVHEYAGPRLDEAQLLARLCGQTIVNFSGGIEPNYYPVSMLWQADQIKPMCSAAWLRHHQRAGNALEATGMLDEARVLLDGVQRGCESVSPSEVRAIRADLARIAATTAKASPAAYDFTWLLNEVKRDPDQQLVRDPRFSAMLVAVVPDTMFERQSLRGALKKSVWLPDATKLIDGRYLVISGCEPHNCPNQGMLWIDTATRQAIAVTGGTLASRSTDPAKIPPLFWTHALEVFGGWHDETVDYIGASGKTVKVTVP
jgi:hypothetical protein